MKNCDEWVKHILEARDKQLAVRRKRRKAALSFSALAACFCVTVLLGSQVYKSVEIIRKDNLMNPSSSCSADETSVSTTDKKSSETTVKTTVYSAETSFKQTKSAVTTDKPSKSTEKPIPNTGYIDQTNADTVPPVTAKPEYKTTAKKIQTSVPATKVTVNNVFTKKTTKLPVQTKPADVPLNTKPETEIEVTITETTTFRNEIEIVTMPVTSETKPENGTTTIPETVIFTSRRPASETVVFQSSAFNKAEDLRSKPNSAGERSSTECKDVHCLRGGR